MVYISMFKFGFFKGHVWVVICAVVGLIMLSALGATNGTLKLITCTTNLLELQ